MNYTPGNKCAKNLCKRVVLLQFIIKNVVTFFGTQCSNIGKTKSNEIKAWFTSPFMSTGQEKDQPYSIALLVKVIFQRVQEVYDFMLKDSISNGFIFLNYYHYQYHYFYY